MDPIGTTFVLALGTALVGAMIAVRLRQSVVIGFILAGIVIGPYTPGIVGDADAVDALANIGIILLLFAIGVQFSVRDLMQVGRIAILGGLTQVVILIGIGYAIGVALGWGSLEAFAFGAVVSNSSSTVLGKVLGDRGELNTIQGRVGLAWSTVQDLSTIALIVILTALASDGGNLVLDMLWALAKAGLFFALLIPIGSKFLPWLFERLATLQNREVFLMAVALLAMGTGYAATFFGLSVAIGAFLAGVIVSESDHSHQILGEIVPIRDIFAGLFFVSVGMLADPEFIIGSFPLVLVGAFTIIVIKGLVATGISMLFEYPLRSSLLIGVTLAQSAEFSFLLARVGVDLEVLSARVFNLLLAATVISIVASPALHRLMNTVTVPLDRRLQNRRFAEEHNHGPPPPPFTGHTIICGYGRVGSRIGAMLQKFGFPFVVIDNNNRVAAHLNNFNSPIYFSSVDNPLVLDRAGLQHARMLVLAVPDVVATRRAVDYAKRVNPDIKIVARSHSDAERMALVDQGVDEAVMGELELALEMTRFALTELGIDPEEARALLERLRRQDERIPWEDAIADLELSTTFSPKTTSIASADDGLHTQQQLQLEQEHAQD